MAAPAGAADDAVLASSESPRPRAFVSAASLPVGGGRQGLATVLAGACALIDQMEALEMNDNADVQAGTDVKPSKSGAIRFTPVDGDASASSARRLFNDSVRRPLTSPPLRMHLLTALHSRVHRLATLRVSLSRCQLGPRWRDFPQIVV